MELLKKLTCITAVSGNEDAVRQLITEEISPYADEIYSDNLGSLICRKKGGGKKIMLTAHMDEIGFIVTVKDSDFTARIGKIGDVDLKYLQNTMVSFENGIRGVVSNDVGKEVSKTTSFDDMFIDIIGENKIETGDTASFAPNFHVSGDYICSKALDNRVGCFILVDIIKNIKKFENDLYFVFTVQNELGMRGAKTAANLIRPEYCINVDMTSCEDKSALKIGDGPAIKIMDASVISHPYIKNKLINAANALNIAVQYEINKKEKTDTGAIALSASGVISGGISVPCRYHHSPTEIASTIDIENTIKILIKVCGDNF